MTGAFPKTTKLYQSLKDSLDSGAWVCDAVDHNAADGCSNPNCLKSKSLIRIIDEPSHKRFCITGPNYDFSSAEGPYIPGTVTSSNRR
jgi:hypothetical protein